MRGEAAPYSLVPSGEASLLQERASETNTSSKVRPANTGGHKASV